MNKKEYGIGIKCTNCDHIPTAVGCRQIDTKIFWIPKGTSVKDYLNSIHCDNCGCVGYLVKVK